MAGECTRDLTVFVQVVSVEIQSKRSGLHIDSAQFVFKFPAQYFQIEKKQYRWTKCSCSRRDPLKDGYDHQPSPTTSSFSEGLHQRQNPPGVGGARLSRNLGARRSLET